MTTSMRRPSNFLGVEQQPTRSQRDEQIHIAYVAGVVTVHRARHRSIGHAPSPGEGEQFVAVGLDQRMHAEKSSQPHDASVPAAKADAMRTPGQSQLLPTRAPQLESQTEPSNATSTACLYIASMQYIKATLLAHSREVRDDESIVEIVIWELPERLPPCLHRYKYRRFYGAPGEERIRYDNERGKGDHRHVGGREFEYAFVSIDALLDDFERDIENWSAS